MDDLISRSALIGKSMNVGLCDPYGNYYGSGDVVLIDDIKAAPTVDAAEVVRCKDCKYYEENTEAITRFCRRELKYLYAEPNGFCSYGERKENGKHNQ